MTKPDFEALRAARNAATDAWLEEMKAQGFTAVSTCALHDRNACYCDCANHGPCEHDWSGPEYVSEDGCLHSATCARCGMTAFSHSLRFMP